MSTAGADHGWTRFTQVQRAMARRMTQAAAVPTVHQYVFATVDASLALVRRLREHAVPVTLTTVVFAATATALVEYPIVAAEVDHERGAWRPAASLDIGVAVASPRGLVVPVVRDVVPGRPAVLLPAITAAVRAARAASTDPQLYRGGTFTVTNLGPDGVDGGVPLPSFPQQAILGVSAARRTPVVEDEHVVIRSVVRLGVSFDHRILDGMTMAGFLRRIRTLLEAPPQEWAQP